MENQAAYASRIFLNAALPLLKVLVEETPKLRKAFSGKNGVVQVSALDKGGRAEAVGKIGTHFVVTNGGLSVVCGCAEKPTLELEFASRESLNAFFSGASKRLPRIKGALRAPGLLLATFRALLAMAAALGAKEPPASPEERALLVKLYFYLLSSGISQLNKAGHPAVKKWTSQSPDRVFAWSVEGRPDLSAYIRVKAGHSRASRGIYERSKPFFTMSFNSPESALGILLERDDMIAATTGGRLNMLGAPEYGAMLGEYMLLVGSLAK
jgi:hypothetical protein